MRKCLAYICFALFLAACTSANIDQQEAAMINVNLGVDYLQEDQVAQAKARLQRAMQEQPNNISVLDAYAYYFEVVGNAARAQALYQQALAAQPSSGAALNNYGSFLCRQGDYAKAIAYFHQATQAPGYIDVAQADENAGICALQLPSKSRALRYFQQAKAHGSTSPLVMREINVLSYK